MIILPPVAATSGPQRRPPLANHAANEDNEVAGEYTEHLADQGRLNNRLQIASRSRLEEYCQSTSPNAQKQSSARKDNSLNWRRLGEKIADAEPG